MRLMHTKLPEFIKKVEDAVKKTDERKSVSLKGLEHLQSAKMQSLRTGRIENSVKALAEREDVERVEVVVMPRVPETMHTVVIKSFGPEGKPVKAVLEVINILHKTEQAELLDFDDESVEDNRPSLGRH